MKGTIVLVLMITAGLLVACGGGAKQVAPTPAPPGPRATPEPVPAPAPVEPPAPEARLALAPIYFDFDRSEIRSDQRGSLAENAKALESHADVSRVTIEGHCDERGTNEYNLALGQRRADSVKNYLVNYGIPRTKLSTVSFGEERPVDPGHTEAAWARNRRAEFVVQN